MHYSSQAKSLKEGSSRTGVVCGLGTSLKARHRGLEMMILEDYADPFDSRQDISGPTEEQERVKSEGYMEPYEAQKLLAEIQKTGSKDGLAVQKPVHLYDTPYEASENGMDSDLQQPSGLQCRYSWLPEDDERPPEEYDQPWEWKKERISRVFAVEIEGIKDLPWPPPVGQLDSSTNHLGAEEPPTLQSISARCLPTDTPPRLQDTSTSLPDFATLTSHLDISSKSTVKNQLPSCTEKRNSACWLSMEHGLAFGERVNPTLPLESQAWYHGTLSRVDAEGLLQLCREASYLVRNSESSHDALSLSLKSSQGFLHMKLLQTEDKKFVLGQHSPPFDNVPEIIHHYASHKLPIQGAEHMSLLYPVTMQPSSCLAAEQ
ncbi:SH2 domain-containing adapter protein F-like isoform X2 [Rhineura floridana]|uniref:SH2 domain-containing adapter protein F-like isoform X2 n=1 Tax=Rhineura floridana TaxID=261503 RepID=UPI002AC8039F|nr:SH2 domain-containing adapter protein F-like isoform X2 [Rhineura floridana]